MALSFSDSELAAYLEEDLDAERASAWNKHYQVTNSCYNAFRRLGNRMTRVNIR